MFLGLVKEPESLVGARDDASSGVITAVWVSPWSDSDPGSPRAGPLIRSTTELMPVKAILPGVLRQ